MTYMPGSFSAYGYTKRKREPITVFGAPLVPFIRNSLLLLIALALLITAFFPLVNFRVRESGVSSYLGVEVHNVRASAFDCLVFVSDAMQSVPTEEQTDSDLYVLYTSISKDIECILLEGGTTDGMLRAEQELNLQLSKVWFRLLLQSEDCAVSVTLLALAAAVLLYLAACIALFVFALRALIRLFTKGETGNPSYGLLFALTAIPCLLCLVLFLAFTSFVPVVHAVAHTTVSLVGGAVFSLVLSLAAWVALTVLRFIRKRPTVRETVFRVATAVCALLVFALAFSPVLSIRMKAQFPGYEEAVAVNIPLTNAYFGELYLTEEEMDDCDILAKSTVEETVAKLDGQFNTLAQLKIARHKAGEANISHFALLRNALAAESAHKFASAFTFVPLCSALAALGALLALQQSLIGLAGGKFGRGAALGGQIASSAFALTALVLIIVFMVIVNANTYEYMTGTYFLNIGAAPLMSLIFTLPGYIFCLLKTKGDDGAEDTEGTPRTPARATSHDQDESL